MDKATFAVLLLAVAPFAIAEDVTQPVSRADVKAETKAAQKAHKLTPAGELSPVPESSGQKSTRTREERKTETLTAAKKHELAPAGNAAALKTDNAIRASKSTKTRDERKAETHVAIKEHQLTPAGEGQDAPRK